MGAGGIDRSRLIMKVAAILLYASEYLEVAGTVPSQSQPKVPSQSQPKLLLLPGEVPELKSWASSCYNDYKGDKKWEGDVKWAYKLAVRMYAEAFSASIVAGCRAP